MSLQDMLEHAEEAIAFLAGVRQDDLREDRMRLLALVHLVEIVGEAANRVPREVQAEHPDIPWKQVIGMRHRLTHGYDQLDVAQVWSTVREDLPALVKALRRALAKR